MHVSRDGPVGERANNSRKSSPPGDIFPNGIRGRGYNRCMAHSRVGIPRLREIVHRNLMKTPTWLLGTLLMASLIAGCSDRVADSQQIEQRMANAVADRDQGQFKEAVIELKNALQLDPDNLKARAMLGDVYMQMGNAAGADKEYRHVQDGHGDVSLYLLSLGDALLRLKEWQEVLNRIRPDPALSVADQARIHAQRGSANIGLENIDAARKEFSSAVALDPNCVSAWLGQAALVIAEGRTATARELVKQARARAQGEDAAEAWRMTAQLAQMDGDFEGAETAYSKAIESSAFKDVLQTSRALARIDMGDYPGAHEDLDAVGEKYPNHPYVLYGQGLLAIREGRFSEARGYLEALKQLMPDDTRGIFYLGVANLAEGNAKDAEHYLAQVVARSQSPKAAMLLGQARYVLGDYRGAAQVLEPLLASEPNDPELQSLLGSVYIAIGETSQGSKLLSSAVARQPDNITDRMRLGLSLVKLGESQAGVKELEKVAADDPESDQARVALMIGYVQTGKLKAARAIALKIRDAAPENAGPWNYLGMVELAAGNRAEAHKAFEKSYSLAPGWPVAGFNLARLEQAEGNVERAKEIGEEILKKHPDHLPTMTYLIGLEETTGNDQYAQQIAEKAIKLYPDELGPRLWLARKFLADGEPKKSLALFEEIEKDHREDIGFLAVLGEAQLRAGETMAGMKTFRGLTELAPKNADIRYMYARACAINNDYLALGNALIEGLRLDPQHPGIPVLIQRFIALSSGQASTEKLLWRMQSAAPDNLFLTRVRAEYAMRNGRAGDAVKIYQKARERFPNEWEWWGQLTYARAQNGDLTSALADIRQWLAMHPKETDAWLLKGKILLADGRPREARDSFAQVLKLDPDNVQAMNNLAWLLRDGDVAKARRYAERAVELEPGYITRDTLGVILMDLGEHEQAEHLFRQAFGEQPQSADIRFHLAQALAHLDRGPEARSLLKELLHDAPKFSEHEQAEQLLARLGG